MTTRRLDATVDAPALFVEVNPFHEISLWSYVAAYTRGSSDLALGPPELFSRELFQALKVEKARFSIRRVLSEVVRHRRRWCYFNTVGFVLYPLTRRTVGDNLSTIASAIGARVLGARLHGIVHEADLFFDTGIFAARRHRWFQRVIGWWFVRLFDEVVVLSPEVRDYLGTHGIRTSVLDSRPLRELVKATDGLDPPGLRGEKVLVWVGPVDSVRRTPAPLLELKPDALDRHGVRVVMVCDIRAGQGLEFKRDVEARGLTPYFTFFERRPSDAEVFDWVRRSAAVLCLYSEAVYGTIKTSGARMWAWAFEKPFLSTLPRLGVYEWDGVEQIRSDDINVCVAALAETQASAGSQPLAQRQGESQRAEAAHDESESM